MADKVKTNASHTDDMSETAGTVPLPVRPALDSDLKPGPASVILRQCR